MTDPDGFGSEEEPERPDLGWPHPGPFGPDELPWVLKMRRDGMSLRAIGKVTGRGFSYVARVCKKAGIGSDVAKPTEPAPKTYGPESPLAATLRLLGEKAARKADVMLNQIDSPIKVRRINTRTGQTERLRLSQPDPGEQRDLAGGARSLIDVVAKAVQVGGATSTRSSIIEFMDRIRDPGNTPRALAREQIKDGVKPADEITSHYHAIVRYEDTLKADHEAQRKADQEKWSDAG